MWTTYWLAKLARSLVYGAFPESFWRSVELVAQRGPEIIERLDALEKRISALEDSRPSKTA